MRNIMRSILLVILALTVLVGAYTVGRVSVAMKGSIQIAKMQVTGKSRFNLFDKTFDGTNIVVDKNVDRQLYTTWRGRKVKVTVEKDVYREADIGDYIYCNLILFGNRVLHAEYIN